MQTPSNIIAGTDRLVKDADAAALFSISRSGWWRGVKEKQYPQPIKVGGSTRWSLNELHAHMQKLMADQRDASEAA